MNLQTQQENTKRQPKPTPELATTIRRIKNLTQAPNNKPQHKHAVLCTKHAMKSVQLTREVNTLNKEMHVNFICKPNFFQQTQPHKHNVSHMVEGQNDEQNPNQYAQTSHPTERAFNHICIFQTTTLKYMSASLYNTEYKYDDALW